MCHLCSALMCDLVSYGVVDYTWSIRQEFFPSEWSWCPTRQLLVTPPNRSATIAKLRYLAKLVIVVCRCQSWIGLLMAFLPWQLVHFQMPWEQVLKEDSWLAVTWFPQVLCLKGVVSSAACPLRCQQCNLFPVKSLFCFWGVWSLQKGSVKHK